jgi:O-antigen ligase
MGFILSILYFVTHYLTPDTVFGPLAVYRVEFILAGLMVLVSLPALPGSFLAKTIQSLALIGLAVAVLMSVVVGEHWAGGGVMAFLSFIPNAFAFFLVCLHCNSKRKLQIIVVMLLLVCFFVIVRGSVDLSTLPDNATYAQANASPYLMVQPNNTGLFYRLRGLGEINDPNDFAQLLVCVIPLIFIFWQPGRGFRNTLFVIVPVCILLVGTFLTHSRGSMIAIVAMAIVAGRRRIGTLPSILLAVGLYVGATALNFTGGRDVSVNAGSDRTALWGTGLGLLKSHPIFGVGFGNFADYAGLTAHNSFVVCAAELGMVGLFFWGMFLLPTVRDALAIASPERVGEQQPIVVTTPPQLFPSPMIAREMEAVSNTEINSLGRLMVLSLTGFLVAGLFLSRAFVMTLFLLGGMTEVVFEMAARQNLIAPRMRLGKVLRSTSVLSVGLIVMMYILLRTVNLMH